MGVKVTLVVALVFLLVGAISSAPTPPVEPSAAPATSAAPLPSERPSSSEAPLPSVGPSSSEAPQPSDGPSSSEAPLPTETSTSSEAPLPSEAPSSSAAPLSSESASPTTTETPATTSSHIPDVIPKSCSERPTANDLMIPSRKSCGRFIVCHGNRATEMDCPPGLWFNYAKQYCDWPENTACEAQ